MLAELMQSSSIQIGVCGSECYLNFKEYKEIRVLEEEQLFVHESDPCLEYICKVTVELCSFIMTLVEL